MNILLWVLQGLAALLFGASGVMKVFMFDKVSGDVPSFGALPKKAWTALGVIELVCVVGLIVPGVLHWKTALTGAAAAVLAVESLVFIWVHAKYREISPIVFCAVLGLLMAFVAYGRAAEPARLTAAEREADRRIAKRVFARVVALKTRYPHLAAVERETKSEDSADKLWIAYHYEHGMSWKRNPDYDPRKKGGARVKVFSPDDGIELNLYFFEGDWLGQAAVTPRALGSMKVVLFVEGAQTPAVAALKKELGAILDDAAAAPPGK